LALLVGEGFFRGEGETHCPDGSEQEEGVVFVAFVGQGGGLFRLFLVVLYVVFQEFTGYLPVGEFEDFLVQGFALHQGDFDGVGLGGD
jgi:hypothetical protein